MGERAFQDQGSVSHCHGCGADNEKGLQIKSFWEGDEAVATWKAQPHHCGGSKDIVNGGIVATLIDCHSLNLAIAHAYRAEGPPYRELAADWVRHRKFEHLLSKADADCRTFAAKSPHRKN